MFKRVSFVLSLAGVAMSSTGCATIVASRTTPYQVVSAVPGAEVRINGMPVGRTPTTLEVDKKQPPRIEVAAPGHYPQTCWPKTTIGAGYIIADTAMCLLLFPFGCIAYIDATGAWNEVSDQVCSVNLQPAAPPVTAAAPAGYAPVAYPPPPPPPPPALVY
jgi:hypothetical protein